MAITPICARCTVSDAHHHHHHWNRFPVRTLLFSLCVTGRPVCLGKLGVFSTFLGHSSLASYASRPASQHALNTPMTTNQPMCVLKGRVERASLASNCNGDSDSISTPILTESKNNLANCPQLDCCYYPYICSINQPLKLIIYLLYNIHDYSICVPP